MVALWVHDRREYAKKRILTLTYRIEIVTKQLARAPRDGVLRRRLMNDRITRRWWLEELR